MDYIYKTLPSLLREVTVKYDKSGEVEATGVAGYRFAYKPVYSGDIEKRTARMYSRYVGPALRAWAKSSKSIPYYGAVIDNDATGVSVNDRIFQTNYNASVNDSYFSYVGTIINLDPMSQKDERSLAQKIDPARFGYPFLSPYVGHVILHDYKIGSDGLDPMDYLNAWKERLDPEDRDLFEQLETLSKGDLTL